MTDLYHRDNLPIVVDHVEDPKLTLAKPLAILARELFAPRRTGIILQPVDLVDDPGAVRLPAYGFELFRCGRLDEKLIACHCASSP